MPLKNRRYRPPRQKYPCARHKASAEERPNAAGITHRTVGAFGESFRNAVSLFFIRDIVGIPTIGAAYFFYFVAGLAAIPFWLALGRRIGKHRAFMCTLLTVAAVSAANFMLDDGDYLPFFLFFIVKGFCFGGLHFLPIAMLADVVDVDSARTGGKRAGAYFAIFGFSEKIAIAFGTGMSLNVVGLLGFDPALGVAGSSDIGVLSLRLVYCFGPVLFYGLALKLIWNYPLTPARHERLRERLARREAAAEVKRRRGNTPDRSLRVRTSSSSPALALRPVRWRVRR